MLWAALGCHKDPEGPSSGGGPVAISFNISLRFVTNPLPHHSSAVAEAAALWERVITGDLPQLSVSPTSGSCGAGVQSENETVDDILIWVEIRSIDGPAKILGQGGPCAVRASNGLPAIGMMILDSADMTHSVIRRVIIHEMGHALGFGTAWTTRGLLDGEGGTDPTFSGAQALAQFNAAGGTDYPGAKVPVENTGGPGTADAHWRESVFGNEVMTGFINGTGDPLSRVTVGSMADLGYSINLDGAEPYTLPPPAVQGHSDPVFLGDDLLRVPVVVVDSLGRVVAHVR